MADTKISGLDAASAADGTEPLAVVQSSATKKMTVEQIRTFIEGDFKKDIIIQAVEGATDTAVGDGIAYFTIPASLNGYNLTAVHAAVVTAGTTGTTDVQIHNLTDSVDMLSTVITIDSGDVGSDTATAAAVIDTSHDDVSTYDRIRIDVDDVSTTAAKGLIVTLTFEKP